MARPYKKDESDELKKRFLPLYEKHLAIPDGACRELGIARSTYHLWRLNDPKFDKECKDIHDGVDDQIDHGIKYKAINGELVAAIFYAKTRMKDRGYVERVEQTGKDGGAIESKTETIVTQNTAPVAKSILEEYEKAILIDKNTGSKATDKHIN